MRCGLVDELEQKDMRATVLFHIEKQERGTRSLLPSCFPSELSSCCLCCVLGCVFSVTRRPQSEKAKCFLPDETSLSCNNLNVLSFTDSKPL